ncbi:cytochrome c family protein [Ponticaulis sp.]|uniref:c-type cytochrome n=1 Tax=Ponticaulis sp. TaxID=2020902 RepID=UPI000B6F1FCA|nr:cytochrome c family protein [Ponticaulis sp.]MAI90299.1 hypothetical protein [Ponticaulis sp.]OUX99940.1 MAG: hypothetical protein CBB65_07650 [Hyphomonadaceae bacterium TMED5]|tara:strand:+ start:278258 stop:279085 length:828 start_codon:yes stop_codon:yes gene_type:complete
MLLNKIAGALLAVALIILALPTLSNIVFQKGGHHGGGHGEEEHSLNERVAATFAYYLPVEESAGGGEAEEEVFDLGAMLAMADIADGEASFRSKCSTCHTIEDGGANGTGPNLHGVVGSGHAQHAGFNYSDAISAIDAPWTYEALNEFLAAPRNAIPGTAMSFAGLRRDPERMNVIAYLASNSPNAPAFPEPLPEEEILEEGAEGEVAVEGEAAVEGEMAEGEAAAETTEVVEGEDAGAALEAIEDAADEAIEAVEEAAEEADDAVHGRRSSTNH